MTKLNELKRKLSYRPADNTSRVLNNQKYHSSKDTPAYQVVPPKLTGINRFIVMHGIIVDAMLSIVFSVSFTSVGLLVRQYLPGSQINYGVLMTTVLLSLVLLLLRRLRLPAVLVFPLHIIVDILYIKILHNTFSYTTHVQDMILLIIMVIGNTIYSVARLIKPRTGKIRIDTAFYPVVINLILHIPFSFLDTELRNTYYDALLVNILIIILAFFIGRQISEFEDGYYHSMRSSMIPLDKIRKQNNLTIFLVIILSVLALFLALIARRILPIDYILSYIKYGIVLFIRFILSLFTSTREVPPQEKPQELPEDINGTGELSPIISILFKVVSVMLLIIAALVIIFAVKRFIQALLRDKEKEKLQTSDNEYIIDIIETVTNDKSKEHKSHDFGKGHERAVRKEFYKRIKSAIRHGADINASDTPQQMSAKAQALNGKSMETLTSEYENIRYSDK